MDLLKTLYEGTAKILFGAGVAEWLSRQPRDLKIGQPDPENGKIAGGLRLAGVRVPSPAPSGNS